MYTESAYDIAEPFTSVQPRISQDEQPTGAITANFFTTGLFAVVLMVGTGGAVTSASACTIANEANRTSPTRDVIVIGSRREHNAEVVNADVIMYVRDQLSLNVSEFAECAGVSRPTVYAWLRAESEPQLNNLARIRVISQIAKRWAAMSTRPLGKYLHYVDDSGSSIFNLLTATEIDERAVREHLDALHAQLVSGQASATESAAAAFARQHTLAPVGREARDQSISEISGF